MSSLSARLLISVSVLLIFFFGVTIVVLDSAFRSAGEQAQEDILDGHLMALLAAAEPSAQGVLEMPPDLHEPRFGNIDSGLYAELRDDQGNIVWQSRSALGFDMPNGPRPRSGVRLFLEETLADGMPLLTLTLAVQWEFPDGELRPFVFKVAESLDSFNAQIAQFRRQLFGWFGAVALIMLLSISIMLRRLLRPLRRIEKEIVEIEDGQRESLSGQFPTELTGVARNLNLLIDSERARSERYKVTLDNLAHSLKTPLAAMRALLNQDKSDEFAKRFNEQIDRMDEIVRYQLRKPAASPADKFALTLVPVKHEVERLIDGLRKVYHDKQPAIAAEIADNMQFRGDSGDFLEIAGNLLDNACKWCKRHVLITIRPASGAGGMFLVVADDGPGIPADAAEALLQRGTRLDESTPGYGIGLAVVKELAESYGGRLDIGQSKLGGAEFRITIPSS
ncbi:MAG: ATP-binding protein [Gammaproteobacteria bacterium]|nr:ATP-binding protein [Gammaproteobacteria bacterium]MDH3374025.1 ATP-binding protein [Gammaproteobacteria bacterium]MDH3408183.1 ATP-binding protein [Gammaproteobacteria bacterium]MDH3553532.1 ATP-binding protein [Gammaproteobacteria bacterium]